MTTPPKSERAETAWTASQSWGEPWISIRNDPALARARERLSVHELRLIIQHAQKDRAELAEMLRRYVYQQTRMLERWAEGDAAVKQELWRNLHALGEPARALLARIRGEAP